MFHHLTVCMHVNILNVFWSFSNSLTPHALGPSWFFFVCLFLKKSQLYIFNWFSLVEIAKTFRIFYWKAYAQAVGETIFFVFI